MSSVSLVWFMILCVTGVTVSASESLPSIELRLSEVLPIDGLQEPSGLTWHEGSLYVISDKDDDTIYSLTLGADLAEARRFLHVNLSDGSGPLDLEGITTDRGDWLLLSELEKKVLRVNPAGQIVCQTRIANYGYSVLFAQRGAGPEGIAVLRGGRIAIASERQPCGLLVLGKSGREFVFDEKIGYPKKGGRPEDATDLLRVGEELWCLSRNAEAIVRLREFDSGWRILGLLSYSNLGDSIEYEDATFGTAEGLAVNDQSVFVVLDNNGLARKIAKNDRRPLLLVFKRPVLNDRTVR